MDPCYNVALVWLFTFYNIAFYKTGSDFGLIIGSDPVGCGIISSSAFSILICLAYRRIKQEIAQQSLADDKAASDSRSRSSSTVESSESERD